MGLTIGRYCSSPTRRVYCNYSAWILPRSGRGLACYFLIGRAGSGEKLVPAEPLCNNKCRYRPSVDLNKKEGCGISLSALNLWARASLVRLLQPWRALIYNNKPSPPRPIYPLFAKQPCTQGSAEAPCWRPPPYIRRPRPWWAINTNNRHPVARLHTAGPAHTVEQRLRRARRVPARAARCSQARRTPRGGSREDERSKQAWERRMQECAFKRELSGCRVGLVARPAFLR